MANIIMTSTFFNATRIAGGSLTTSHHVTGEITLSLSRRGKHVKVKQAGVTIAKVYRRCRVEGSKAIRQALKDLSCQVVIQAIKAA